MLLIISIIIWIWLKIAKEVAVGRLLIFSGQELHEGGGEFLVTDFSIIIRVDDGECLGRLCLVVTKEFKEALQLRHLDESVPVRVDNSKHDITDPLVESAEPVESLLAKEADEIFGSDRLNLAVSFDDFFPDRQKLLLHFRFPGLVDLRGGGGKTFPHQFVILFCDDAIFVHVQNRKEL